jgi:predicted RNA binding protein YcfA (HicA-like mRNA interferase family)
MRYTEIEPSETGRARVSGGFSLIRAQLCRNSGYVHQIVLLYPLCGGGMNKQKLLKKILAGSKNVHFSDMTSLVEAFGFRLSRVNGSHFVFVHPVIPEPVNLQEHKGKAKPYQVRQFLQLVEEYHLELGD